MTGLDTVIRHLLPVVAVRMASPQTGARPRRGLGRGVWGVGRGAWGVRMRPPTAGIFRRWDWGSRLWVGSPGPGASWGRPPAPWAPPLCGRSDMHPAHLRLGAQEGPWDSRERRGRAPPRSSRPRRLLDTWSPACLQTKEPVTGSPTGPGPAFLGRRTGFVAELCDAPGAASGWCQCRRLKLRPWGDGR